MAVHQRGRSPHRERERDSLKFTIIVIVAVFAITARLGAYAYDARVWTLAGIYAVLALGFRVTLGELGELSLGHTVYYGLSAYAVAIGARDTGRG